MTDSPIMTVEALRSVPLFASVGDEDALALMGLLKSRSLPRGALLFRQGEAGDAMYLVEAGRVRIFVTDEDGEELTLAELQRGDFFGEMALVEGKARTASARAVDDALLYSLAREDFLSFIRKNSDVALAMVRAISERLRRTDELLRRRVSRNANVEDAARLTVADRLADRLTEFGGSWAFISVTLVLIALWVVVNSVFLRGLGPDPYPYSFLDVMNGIVAALLTPVILISQKRQSERDRLKADLDFQINLKNELAIAEILRRLDVLESERLPALIAASRTQPAEGAPPDRPTV
ncbi:MAG: cyclic nucleotide-binding domain-containing protein [Acidobacteria bacterium]|nr:cyclic nucleotide-binding domain-containing protein [Acidobacteriota bacterium]